VIKVMD